MSGPKQKKPPVLGDTKRPVVPQRMQRWLKEADAVREAKARGVSDDALEAIKRKARDGEP